jgi:hypothetical protein
MRIVAACAVQRVAGSCHLIHGQAVTDSALLKVEADTLRVYRMCVGVLPYGTPHVRPVYVLGLRVWRVHIGRGKWNKPLCVNKRHKGVTRPSESRFRVQGLGFRGEDGLCCRVYGLGFGVWGLGLW